MQFSKIASQKADQTDLVEVMSPEYNFALSQIDMAKAKLKDPGFTTEFSDPTPSTLDNQILALIDAVSYTG